MIAAIGDSGCNAASDTPTFHADTSRIHIEKNAFNGIAELRKHGLAHIALIGYAADNDVLAVFGKGLSPLIFPARIPIWIQ